MRNRAKCKLCSSIIESFHLFDFVRCTCDEIGISGGSVKYDCSAKNWENFLRVDDEDNEIQIKVIEKRKDIDMNDPTKDPEPMSKQACIEMLEAMLKNIQNLPQNALTSPISHYDLFNYLTVVLAIFKHPDK